jgi:hypothetical protein
MQLLTADDDVENNKSFGNFSLFGKAKKCVIFKMEDENYSDDEDSTQVPCVNSTENTSSDISALRDSIKKKGSNR